MKLYINNKRTTVSTGLLYGLLASFLLIVCTSFQEVIAQDKHTSSEETNLGLKPNDFLPEDAWNYRFKFTYLDGRPQEEKQLSDYKGKMLYFFFWDTSYPNSYSDLRKLYEMCLIPTDKFAVFIVHSKKSKDTPRQLKAMMDRFQKEFGDVMDAPLIMDDEYFTSLFKPKQLLHMTFILNDGMIHLSDYHKAKL